MKAIKITKEHESKLLEMCKILFPEYGNISISKIEAEEDDSYIHMIDLYKKNINYIKKNRFNYPYIITSIHWFEFCTLHLSNKIYFLLDRKTNGTGLSWEEDFAYAIISKERKNHLIDFLYDQFKKLK